MLLAPQQANKLRHKLLGQGIAILFGKPANREDDGCVPPENHLACIRIQASCILEGEGVKNIAWFLPVSLPRGCVHFFLSAVIYQLGLVRRFPVN